MEQATAQRAWAMSPPVFVNCCLKGARKTKGPPRLSAIRPPPVRFEPLSPSLSSLFPDDIIHRLCKLLLALNFPSERLTTMREVGSLQRTKKGKWRNKPKKTKYKTSRNFLAFGKGQQQRDKETKPKKQSKNGRQSRAAGKRTNCAVIRKVNDSFRS